MTRVECKPLYFIIFPNRFALFLSQLSSYLIFILARDLTVLRRHIGVGMSGISLSYQLNTQLTIPYLQGGDRITEHSRSRYMGKIQLLVSA